jgi:hypothetical protein
MQLTWMIVLMLLIDMISKGATPIDPTLLTMIEISLTFCNSLFQTIIAFVCVGNVEVKQDISNFDIWIDLME